MYINILAFALGLGIGMLTMRAIINYAEKHLRTERSKTERYRGLYENARVSLAQLQCVTQPADLEPVEPPMPLIFTQDDEKALRSGKRVTRIVNGGAKK